MANDEDSIDDKEDATAPAKEPGDKPAIPTVDGKDEVASKARALTDRVRRKIKSVSSKNKRWIN